MKFASLGITPETLSAVRALWAAGHSLRDLFDPFPETLELAAAVPQMQIRHDWENLLHDQEFDAVLIAGPLMSDALSSEQKIRREDQLRKLVQARVPLITFPPVCEAILGFELEMIRRDVQGLIASYYPEAEHPVWRELQQRAESVEQITVEHGLVLRSRSAVQAAFVQDLEILRHFLGPLRSVTASGGELRPGERPELTHLSVSVMGTQACAVRWSVLPMREAAETRFQFFSASGTTTIVVPAESASPAEWKRITTSTETLAPMPNVEPFLTQFQQALRNESQSLTPWLDSCRNVEAMEAIDRSIERSRTIQLYNEELSEAASFKGTMAVWGCLLLMLTLFVFIAVGVLPLLLGFKKGSGNPWWILQTCLIVPFVIFLLLQLLSFGLHAHQQRKQAQLAKGKATGKDA
jgi:hypothetical protein